MNIFVFDIETIPDCEAARRLHHSPEWNNSDAANALFAEAREQNGRDFLPHYLQKIIVISAVLKTPQGIKVWSLGQEDADEKELITRFFDGIERFSPVLVSWNGSGFDLPVLHYRALLQGVTAPRYWENGNNDNQFRWNNYLNRYHERHLDLMDVLAAYQAKAYAPLDRIATLLGYPGKMGMAGDQVWPAYQQGQLSAIRDYCETDVLNTYLVYLRFEQIRGHLSAIDYQTACDELRQYLSAENKTHFNEFIQQWSTR
ncbi:MAG: 3'-5' exonuclease [Gammaproteobacteria bacterium]|nr:3'-5' exonuclease [Gammaproteobacteria bacterium]